MISRRAGGLIVPLCLLGLAGCPARPARPPAPPAALLPAFREVARDLGVDWVHQPCRTGKKLFPESMGPGGGFLDYDRDGRLDLLLVNGAPLPGYRGSVPHHALLRNTGQGFVDVTSTAGLSSSHYGMGAAVGDFDNDGWPDVYLSGLSGGRLYRNLHGHFQDVTERSGLKQQGWSTGAAWLDYDHDGRLDLYVAHYVKWSPATDIPCGDEKHRQYCPPTQYEAEPPRLYHNAGDGRFTDVTARAGVLGHSGKSLSCTPCDVNDDGWGDLFIANDTEPDLLLLNQKNGTFAERGTSAGISVNTDGRATGSMGVDWATPYRDARQAFAVGDFVGQGLSFFAATGPPGAEPLFDNVKYEIGVGDPSAPMSTFGVVFADVNNDGWPDLLALNGHLDESLSVGERHEPYRQLPQLFLNRGGTFEEAGGRAGLSEALVGRALAVGDYDNDGRPDFLALENGGRARLWHNETPNGGDWLGVVLTGTKSPRDGQGALVTVRGGGWSQTRIASTTRSYLAANDPRVHFGLGALRPETLEVRWPSGRVDRIPAPPTGRYVSVREGEWVRE